MNYFEFVRALRFGIAEDRAPWREELHPRGIGGRFARTAVRLYQIDKSRFMPNTTRKQIIEIGKRSVAEEFGVPYDEGMALSVPMDGKSQVFISTRGLSHGLRPYNAKKFSRLKANQLYNAYVMSVLGKVLRQSVLIREDAPDGSEEGETGSALYISACRDGDELVPVIIRVNGKGTGDGSSVEEVFVLKSVNAKKSERDHAISDSRWSADDLVPRISVSQLLAVCQSCFSDFSNS